MPVHATPPAPPALTKKLVFAHGLPVAWLVTHHQHGKTWTVRVRITAAQATDSGGFAGTGVAPVRTHPIAHPRVDARITIPRDIVVAPAGRQTISATDSGGFAG